MSAKGAAVGLIALLLALQVPLRARADDCTGPAQATERVASLPPPGTCRLIRIGPQALVSEDDRGRLTMVDEFEPEPDPRRRRLAGFLIAVLTAGAVMTLDISELSSGGTGSRVGTPRTAP